jgi:hypothetical protein
VSNLETVYAVGRMMSGGRFTRFGGVLSDVTDPFVDVLTSVRDRIPLDDIGDVFKDVAEYITEPITDVWNNPKRTIFRVASVMGWPGFVASFLPGALGIAAEKAIVAFPGLVEGESFTQAFRAEAAWRMKIVERYTLVKAALDYADAVDKAAKNPEVIAHVGKAEFDRLVDDLRRRGFSEQAAVEQAIRQLKLTPGDLSGLCAQASGVPCREDAVATIVNGLLKRPIYDLGKFDLATGSSFGTLEADPTIPQNLAAEEYRRLLGDAQIHGSPPPVVDELRRLLDVAIAREADATIPLADRWRAAERNARTNPADATLRRKADDLRIAYETATTPADRFRDAAAALAGARAERVRAGQRQPPAPPADLALLDGNVLDLQREVDARFRLTPVAKDSVRVLLDPTPTARLRQLGTVALLTSPLWGYAVYRNRSVILSALRGLFP